MDRVADYGLAGIALYAAIHLGTKAITYARRNGNGKAPDHLKELLVVMRDHAKEEQDHHARNAAQTDIMQATLNQIAQNTARIIGRTDRE